MQLDEERKSTAQWHYLSFACPYGFLGAAIVRAHGRISAEQRVRDLGFYPIDPEVDVMCWPIPRKDLWRVPSDLRNRILSEAEVVERLDGRSVTE